VTPVMQFTRTAAHDTEVGGVDVPAGGRVLMVYTSANRDERAFERPDGLDITRDPNDHVAFGAGGPHFCLGAHLAKLEVKIWLEEMIPYLQRIELAGQPTRLRSNFFNGIKRLPVRVIA